MKYFLVSEDVAERSGAIGERYRVGDDMYILNETDMKMVRLEPEEYLGGIASRVLTDREAKELIRANGSRMGRKTGTESPGGEEQAAAQEESPGEAGQAAVEQAAADGTADGTVDDSKTNKE